MIKIYDDNYIYNTEDCPNARSYYINDQTMYGIIGGSLGKNYRKITLQDILKVDPKGIINYTAKQLIRDACIQVIGEL